MTENPQPVESAKMTPPEPRRGLARALHRVGQWAPTNPIIGRIVRSAAPKLSYTLMRYGFLAGIVLLMLFAMLFSGLGGSPKDLAKRGATIFNSLAWLQLGMICIIAPVFAAGAITQEKDNRTFDILLSTPLSNAAIVLGTLLSRLFLIVALVASALPVMFIARLYGGVSNDQIMGTFVIGVSTAMLVSCLAILISVSGVGTRSTTATFCLVFEGYLLLSGAGSLLVPTGIGSTSWLDPVNPFLAQLAVLNPERTVPISELGALHPIHAQWVCQPQWTYPLVACGLSLILIIIAIAAVRLVPRRTTSRRNGPKSLTRKPRTVWANPIAWREANSRAAGTRGLGRKAYLAVGALATAGLLAAYHKMPSQATLSGLAMLVTVVALVMLVGTRFVRRWTNARAAARETRRREGDTNAFETMWEAAVGKPGPILIALGVVAMIVTLLVTPDSGPLARWIGGFAPAAILLYAAMRLAAQLLASLDHTMARGAELRHSLIRWAIVVAAVVLAAGLLAAMPGSTPGAGATEAGRRAIWILTLACLLLLLIAAANAASTSMTAEKEAQTIDLLMLTPMSSNYHVWGKLRGLLASVLPMMVVPVLLLATVFLYDEFSRAAFAASGEQPYSLGYTITTGSVGHVLDGSSSPLVHLRLLPFEAVLLVPMIMLVTAAITCVVGLAMSLYMKRSITAFMATVSILSTVNILVGFWGLSGLTAFPDAGAILTPLCPFTSLIATIDPWMPEYRVVTDSLLGYRIGNAIGVLAATAGVALTTWVILKAVVRSFDRIIRRQDG